MRLSYLTGGDSEHRGPPAKRKQTALQLEGAYVMLLTNRGILEPALEANLYGRNDAGREPGAGLADSEVGLRCEIRSA